MLSLWDTSIGKKAVMAVSGFILWGYLMLHLWGNLKIFLGRDFVNSYGVWLRVVGDPFFQREWLLWIVRVILLVALVLHVLAAYQLTRRDWDGRPIKYAQKKNVQASYASITMRWGGVLVLLFIFYHVADLTLGSTGARFAEGDIYDNVIYSFQRWPVSLFYMLALAMLGLHLFHGLWSMFQTLGLNTTRSNRFWRNVATFFAVLFVVGNWSIPIAVLAGFLRPAV